MDPESVFQVRSELLDVAWSAFFDAMGRERIPDKVLVKPVPVSLVDHENWQLTFDRKCILNSVLPIFFMDELPEYCTRAHGTNSMV